MIQNLRTIGKCVLAGGLAFGISAGIAGARTIKLQQVLHTFCSEANCTDGNGPGDLIMDSSGNIYGTAVEGGNTNAACHDGCGLVFKLAPNGTETILYNFCSQANCSDGAAPYAGLIMDGS